MNLVVRAEASTGLHHGGATTMQGGRRHGLVTTSGSVVRLVRFLLRGDSQSPSNRALRRRVPGVFVQRKRSRGIGNGFTSAAAASIDARPEGRLSGLILPVELRTDADFHVVATLEECHD